MHKTYELAFHLDPNLEEANVSQIKEDIEKTINSNGGSVSFSKEPEKTRLSYPVKDNTTAYFGYMHFSIDDSENLKQVDEHMKRSPSVLRYLLLKFEADTQKDRDIMRRMTMGGERAKKGRDSFQKKEVSKPAELPVQEEELEKKLEEIIDKL